MTEAITTQRAIRRCKPDPVDDALVLRLIELAMKAPTGSNAQNWEFIVIRDPAVKARLARANRQAWSIYGRIGRLVKRNDPATLRIIDAVQWQCDHFEEIPVIVVACLRGPRLPLESLVKRQTSETADFFGFHDHGRLEPGLRADVNLIDFDRLRLHKPELVHDMPAGGRRFVQRVDGYVATLAAGIPIFERGEHTGAMPGRLVRAGHNSHR